MKIQQFDSDSSIIMIQELMEKHNNYEMKEEYQLLI